MLMVDLFSGAGGLSIGLKEAGFHAELALEINRDACETYSRRFPRVNLIDRDIRGFDFSFLRGRTTLVAGGPPCQPFSSGGKRLAQADERNMVPEFLRAVSQIEAPLILMENVPGLATGDRQAYLMSVVSALMDMGYDVSWKIVHAADYGVPQKRKRLVVVGSKLGTFHFPDKTHGPGRRFPFVTAGDVLKVDQVLGTPNTAKVTYAKNPDLRPSPYDGLLFNGGGRPINLNDLCHTILASAGGNKTHFLDTRNEVPAYHAELTQGRPPRKGILLGGRRLTVAESAAIQTFPEDMYFAGTSSSQYTQVGNAVPPRLARAIGAALMDHFLQHTERASSM